MDGDHTIEHAAHVTSRTILAVFTELHDQRVHLDGMLLKPNMVLAGYAAAVQPSPDEVADATLACLRRTVPAAVPGIVFLSGGQSDERATANLNAIPGQGPQAWQISFSYGRALQAAALKAWAGEPANVADAQRAFHRRAKLNAAATAGRYKPAMESAA